MAQDKSPKLLKRLAELRCVATIESSAPVASIRRAAAADLASISHNLADEAAKFVEAGSGEIVSRGAGGVAD